MATTTMPPTTHALPHAQRLRLMRSTRKLGALLGETLLVETTPPLPLTHARSASAIDSRVYQETPTHPRGSSVSLKLTKSAPVPHPEVPSHAHGHAHSDRPTLVLRLPPPSPAASAQSPATPLVSPSPLSPTFGLALNSPVTPTFPAAPPPSRRRKMAKLVRTLGENVPPELVFPTSTAASASTSTPRRRASMLSVHRAADEPFSYPSTVPVPYESRESTDTQRTSAETHTSSTSSSSSELLLPNPPLHPHARTRSHGMHRSEQGWSGEWGGAVADMEDVVRNLRSLRMK